MHTQLVALATLLCVLNVYCQLNKTDLCGAWQPDYTGKDICTPGQLCTGDSVPTFVVTETFQLGFDETYTINFRMATGGCPINEASGVVILAVDTIGNYTLLGNNTNSSLGARWNKIKYTPGRFRVAILKNQKDIYYTFSSPGPCLPPVSFWNSPTNGCPCNGTYDQNGAYNTTSKQYDNYREIIKSQCPNGTCPEYFFLRDKERYGNVRVNQTGTTKQMELTFTSEDSAIGYSYGNADIQFVFEAPVGPCQTSVDPNAVPPSSDSTTPAILFQLIVSMLLMVVVGLFEI